MRRSAKCSATRATSPPPASGWPRRDPGNAGWQRDIFVSYTNVGLVTDFPAGFDPFDRERRSLRISRINPTVASRVPDLAWEPVRLEETRRKLAASVPPGNRKR